jgi:hypothetical protein
MLKFMRQAFGLDAGGDQATLQVNATGKDTVKIAGNGKSPKDGTTSGKLGNNQAKDKGTPPGHLKQKTK